MLSANNNAFDNTTSNTLIYDNVFKWYI